MEFFDIFIFNNVKSDLNVILNQLNKVVFKVKVLSLQRLYPYRKPRWAEVKAAIKEAQPHDHYILIKGSNSVKLFQLPELL